MTTQTAEETTTRPADTGERLLHLFCIPHGHNPGAIARCGHRSTKQSNGQIVYPNEAEQIGCCVVCVDLAKQGIHQCPQCPKERT